MALKDWKKTGTEGDWTFFETKRRSKVYKGQPYDTIIVRRHPLNESKWTIDYGQSVSSMHKFKNKTIAMRKAKSYMRRH